MNGPLQGLGFLRATAEAARQTFRLQRHNRMLWIVVGTSLALGAIAYVLGGRMHERFDGRSLFCLLAWWLLATVLVPWTTLYLGVQAVHGPLEDRTFQYLFLRPVSRAAFLLGNWIAIAAIAAVTASFGVAVLFLGTAARPDTWGDGVDWNLLLVFVAMFALACIAYGAVAVLFGAYFRRPLVWGAFFVVGLQMLTANLPVSAGLRRITVTDPLRRFLLDGIEPDARLARRLWPAEQQFQPDMVGHPVFDLAVFTLVCILLAAWSYSRTEYDSRSRE